VIIIIIRIRGYIYRCLSHSYRVSAKLKYLKVTKLYWTVGVCAVYYYFF